MPENAEPGTIMVLAKRLGTVSEIKAFLQDFEAAYAAAYTFDLYWLNGRGKRLRRFPIEFLVDIGFPLYLQPSFAKPTTEAVLPEYQLVLSRVRIESPGFWEFLGSLNPLQQIREYLNDRHRRIQDKQYRNATEKERLKLENELLRRRITESDNSNLRERIEILRGLGFSDEEIRHLIWTNVGKSLAQLGRHQDTGLIENVE